MSTFKFKHAASVVVAAGIGGGIIFWGVSDLLEARAAMEQGQAKQASIIASAEAILKAGGGVPARVVVGDDGKVLCYQKPPMPEPSCR